MVDPKSGASWIALKFIENLSNMVVRDAIGSGRSTLAPLLHMKTLHRFESM